MAATLESRLRARIRDLDSALVALSGGVDSSVVTCIAAQELGPGAVAATGISASLPQAELEGVRALCRRLGIDHVAIETHELAVAGYVENSPERCYYCKTELFTVLRKEADQRGIVHLLDGTTREDLGGHRPGKRAADELGVISPLVDVDAAKQDVRELARRLELPMAERPASPCLSSRIAYGVPVTADRLARIGEAEAFLRELGFGDLRVRLHGDIARIEVPAKKLEHAVANAGAITERLNALGFTYVTLDLRGLRSGSLLEVVRP